MRVSLPSLVEQTQLHALGDLGEHREVGADAVEGRAERVTAALARSACTLRLEAVALDCACRSSHPCCCSYNSSVGQAARATIEGTPLVKTVTVRRSTLARDPRHCRRCAVRAAVAGRPRRAVEETASSSACRRRPATRARPCSPGRQRGRRSRRDGVRAGRDASRAPATSAAAASWSCAPADGAATTFDYREKAPLQVDAHDVPRRRRQDRPPPDGCRAISRPACPAPSAASSSRTSASASCRGRTSSCRRSRSRRTASRSQRSAGARRSTASCRRGMAQVPGVGRGLRQAGRRPVGGGRPAGARATSRKTLRAIADDGADAFYKGWIADRIADGHEGQRRPHHQGGPRGVRGQGARAGPRHVSAASRSSRCRRRAPAASRSSRC